MRAVYHIKKYRAAGLSAFSLLELITVIAIIAIIAALLLPTFSQAKSRAQQVKCVGNLHQLGVGLANFVADNHAYPSHFAGPNSDNSGPWELQLERGGFDNSKPQKNFWKVGVWHCPAAQGRANGQSYGYNSFGSLRFGNLTNNFGLHGLWVAGSGMVPVAESEVVVPSDMMAIGESDSMDFGRSESYNFQHKILRHRNLSNVVFCDGHVESQTVQFLFEDTSDAALVRWNRDHLPHRERLSP
jgi:prepilin-type processing-associated H-X9-DG protein/prepilin-type N-terminal cleavage/methylation domain-containing protein